ncbi:hypothetical protein [Mycolicibacterium sp. CBMA 226]|uniref:hypothetical protein n=1 Tax=Mycolicibacterium sp. CBMA 226 TaxID=2606611 RepID=UPI0012DBF81A|nr:hypothetical protein [Mycolicibacterium sp. CBMA 226]MUL75713.1 hypothetical protein [Mycolicibacterium sp. CBMA 226]
MTGDNDGSTPPVEIGYQWLADRSKAALDRLQAIELADTSPLNADDLYFHPIFRTFRQNIVQCLYSALDHLRFLAWSLQNHKTPFPYAQATLIRTAITGSSLAMWMVSGSTPDERRRRALEFTYNDLKSERGRINTMATDPKNLQLWATAQDEVDAHRDSIEQRLDWIVQQASTLISPPPTSRGTYQKTFTDEIDIVRMAGAMAPQVGNGGWDPGTTLAQTWQILSGYAHARPWAALHGGTVTVKDPTPDPKTGLIVMSAKGDPDKLLDFAFRPVQVAESAVDRLAQLAAQ